LHLFLSLPLTVFTASSHEHLLLEGVSISPGSRVRIDLFLPIILHHINRRGKILDLVSRHVSLFLAASNNRQDQRQHRSHQTEETISEYHFCTI
ncbi:hypothetical protein PMAYCL1PPCAC_22922, partial [Pristionchus mayeri]